MSMSRIFQDASAQAMQQGGEDMPTGGVILPDKNGNKNPDTPISQQSFAMDRGALDKRVYEDIPPIPNMPLLNLPGIGLVGPGEGYAKGVQMRQQYYMNQAANARDEETLGINKAKLANEQSYVKMAQQRLGIDLNEAAMKSKDFEDEQSLQSGMIDAAKTGGYGGVIEFLKYAAPLKALTFETSKLMLDDAIMKNQVMQAQLPAARGQALMDTYKVGARFAGAILSAPVDQQQEMYKQALPALQQLVGSGTLPAEYDETAKAGLQLFAVQGTPESQQSAQQAMHDYSQITIGKLTLAKKAADKMYGPDSQESADINGQIIAERDKGNTALMQAKAAEATVAQKNQTMELALPKTALSYNNAIRQSSQSYIDTANDLYQMKSMATKIKEEAAKGNIDSVSIAALQGRLIKVNSGGGAPSESDARRSVPSAGLGTLSKTVQSWLSGKNEALSLPEVLQVYQLADYQFNAINGRQKRLEQQWKDSVADNPDLQKRLIMPSENFEVQGQAQNVAQDGGKVAYTKSDIDSQFDQGMAMVSTIKDDAKRKEATQKLQQLKQQSYLQNGITTKDEIDTSVTGAP